MHAGRRPARRAAEPHSVERQQAVAALQARVALMSDDERQAWAAGTSVAEVQAERARRERLVSDGAAGARIVAAHIAREWEVGVGGKRAAGARGEREGEEGDVLGARCG